MSQGVDTYHTEGDQLLRDRRMSIIITSLATARGPSIISSLLEAWTEASSTILHSSTYISSALGTSRGKREDPQSPTLELVA